MKNTLLIFMLAVVTNGLHAHPGLHHHAHDSFIGEWGWVLLLSLFVLAILWRSTRGSKDQEEHEVV